MKNQAEKSGSLSIAKKAIENDIQKQLLATTSLVGFEPQHIEAPYSKRIKKDIPVVFNGTNPDKSRFPRIRKHNDLTDEYQCICQ